MSDHALAVKGLNATLGCVPVLKDITLHLRAGTWTSVVGPNGAGKSTLLKAMAGLLPACGEVVLLGRALEDWPRQERARALAWLGQGESAMDELTVYDVVMLGRLPHLAWLQPPTEQDHAIVRAALAQTRAGQWHDRPLGALSGGERQRVLLARALAVEAQVLLMDEPLANLDPPFQSDWMRLVCALTAQGRTVVSVLHEISTALQADEMLIMQQGRVLHHGACADTSTHRSLESVFEHRIAIHAIAGRLVSLPL